MCLWEGKVQPKASVSLLMLRIRSSSTNGCHSSLKSLGSDIYPLKDLLENIYGGQRKGEGSCLAGSGV